MSQENEFTKIVVDLPHNGVSGGEGMWARPLGEDLFEIRNIPFQSYGLNYLDIVRAVEPSPDKKPVVLEIVKASGHQTLRICFTDLIPEPERPDLLSQLNDHKAFFEGATPSYYAIDIEPEGDYSAVRAQLDEWEEAGILNYETCEARIPGSFDDYPDD